MADAASVVMTPPASRSGRPEPVLFIERPTHGVKQLRPSHVSATDAKYKVLVLSILDRAGRNRESGRGHAGRRACRRRAAPPLPRDRASHPSMTVLASVVCPTPCSA